jgi:hypothetical protein
MNRGMRAGLSMSLAAGVALTVLPLGAAAQAATDSQAPTLSAVWSVRARVHAGDPLLVGFSGTDDRPGPLYVDASMSAADGSTVRLSSSMTGSGSGFSPVAGVVPIGAKTATYALTAISVSDRAGNRTDYAVGTATSTPPGTALPLDLSAVTIDVVQPRRPDVTAPTLTSFTMLSGATRHRGGFATWRFTARDDRSPITQAKVFVKMPNGSVGWAEREYTDLRHARVSLWIPPGAPLGRWTVVGVQLVDSSGNLRNFSRRGVGEQLGQPSVAGPLFRHMHFDVVRGRPGPDPWMVQNSVANTVVAARTSADTVAADSTVRLFGTVTFVGQPVPMPVIAFYANDGSGYKRVGLIRGAANGSFVFHLRVLTSTSYRVRFLGGEHGRLAAPQRMSRTLHIQVAG